MTKKDFEAIASAMKDAREASDPRDFSVTHHRVFDSLSRSVADVCARQNPKFQRLRFLAACGVK